jgi:hypothetical protein
MENPHQASHWLSADHAHVPYMVLTQFTIDQVAAWYYSIRPWVLVAYSAGFILIHPFLRDSLWLVVPYLDLLASARLFSGFLSFKFVETVQGYF